MLNGALSSMAAGVEFREELDPSSSASRCVRCPRSPFYFSDEAQDVGVEVAGEVA